MGETHWLPQENIGALVPWASLFQITTVTCYDPVKFKIGSYRSDGYGSTISVIVCACRREIPHRSYGTVSMSSEVR